MLWEKSCILKKIVWIKGIKKNTPKIAKAGKIKRYGVIFNENLCINYYDKSLARILQF